MRGYRLQSLREESISPKVNGKEEGAGETIIFNHKLTMPVKKERKRSTQNPFPDGSSGPTVSPQKNEDQSPGPSCVSVKSATSMFLPFDFREEGSKP
ncbi:hypothetical protein ATANTOWER_003535 [Ataeniobius toweri]|uniref:Uncharacterized protein n=1 Tax=Ataeniobius toweri TaxID=208326 RepID=A0ABU7C8Q0_9TELE|nr:hypothetical protein [Ataeniobius toweri]